MALKRLTSFDIFIQSWMMDVTPTGSKDFTSLTAPKTRLHGRAIPGPL
jgi:hypothetical protein